jgi:uncharacterized protein (UPF0261 family)
MAGKPQIIVAGILDTKGNEIRFLADRVRAAGGEPTIMELTVGGKPAEFADIPVSKLAARAGRKAEELAGLDRAKAADIVMAGGRLVANDLLAQGKLDGIIAFGGSMGSSIAAHIMQGLPIGVPKVLLSTMTSGDVGPYVGTKDITMVYPIAEVGLNKVTRKVLNNAAAAVVGMASAPALETTAEKPLIGCMMFGVTTPTVLRAAKHFEDRGYDVMINHAVGSGGRSMEELIADGYIVGMLDITTHEIADELFGGVLGAGPDRLTAASKKGIPQVVSVGGLDLLNFGPRDTLPKKYEDEEHQPGRGIYVHNPTVTCAGVSLDEAEQLGREIATKLNTATAPAVLCIPLQGWGAVDTAGKDPSLGWPGPDPGPVWWPDRKNPKWTLRNEPFVHGLVSTFDFGKSNLDVIAVDRHMNDPVFADLMAELLDEMLGGKWHKGSHHDRPDVVEVTRSGLAS